MSSIHVIIYKDHFSLNKKQDTELWQPVSLCGSLFSVLDQAQVYFSTFSSGIIIWHENTAKISGNAERIPILQQGKPWVPLYSYYSFM